MQISSTVALRPSATDFVKDLPGWFLITLWMAVSAWFSVSLSAEDYYRWRGPDLNGISAETGWSTDWPSSGPTVLWEASVGIGFSSIAVSEGRAFTMGNNNDQDAVFCFDAATGEKQWVHVYPHKLDDKYYEGGTSSTPTVDGDRVYTLSKRGHLFCLAVEDGKVIWSKEVATEWNVKVPTWGFASSALIVGDVIFLNVGTAGTAVNKMTGALIWTSGTEAAGYATPVPYRLGDQEGLAIFGAKYLYGVDPKTGKELWKHRWKTNYDVNAADPIMAGNQIFVSSGYNTGSALLELEGGSVREIWMNKNLRNKFNTSILINGFVYGFDEQNPDNLKCLKLSDGSVQWDVADLGNGSLMAADGKLIILSEKGELIIAMANPEQFEPIARAQVLTGKCWTTPVLSNGRIYCRNAKGDVVCLDVSGK